MVCCCRCIEAEFVLRDRFLSDSVAKVFRFAAPVISMVRQNAPLSGSSSVTATGLNFANSHYAHYPHQHLYTAGGLRSDPPHGRENTITVTRSASTWDQLAGAVMNGLVDGIYHDQWNRLSNGIISATGPLGTSTWLKFEFGSAVIVSGFIPYQSPTSTNGWGGIWKFEGSNDDATYSVLWTGEPNSKLTNSIASPDMYRYYRFISASGSGLGAILYEIEFVIAEGLCQTSSWSSQSSLLCLIHARMHPRHLDFVHVTVGALVGTNQATFSFDGKHLLVCACYKFRVNDSLPAIISFHFLLWTTTCNEWFVLSATTAVHGEHNCITNQ